MAGSDRRSVGHPYEPMRLIPIHGSWGTQGTSPLGNPLGMPRHGVGRTPHLFSRPCGHPDAGARASRRRGPRIPTQGPAHPDAGPGPSRRRARPSRRRDPPIPTQGPAHPDAGTRPSRRSDRPRTTIMGRAPSLRPSLSFSSPSGARFPHAMRVSRPRDPRHASTMSTRPDGVVRGDRPSTPCILAKGAAGPLVPQLGRQVVSRTERLVTTLGLREFAWSLGSASVSSTRSTPVRRTRTTVACGLRSSPLRQPPFASVVSMRAKKGAPCGR